MNRVTQLYEESLDKHIIVIFYLILLTFSLETNNNK